MKKITLFFLIFTTLPIFSQWIEQNSGVDKYLNDVYCVSDQVVYVVGDNGTILKTIDGGDNWVSKNSGTEVNLSFVQFVNQDIGFALGANGTLLKTINGGESWVSSTSSDSNVNLPRGLSCINQNVLFASFGLLKKSTDGGLTFQNLTFPNDLTVEKFQFIDEMCGFIYSSGQLYKTINGGTNWSLILDNTEVSSFFFLNQNIGFVYKNFGEGQYKTTDGGVTFIEMPSTNISESIDLFSLNENIIWEVNKSMLLCFCPPSFFITKKNFLETPENYEQNYEPDYLETLNLKAIHFASETKGFSVGGYTNTTPFGPAYSKGLIFKNSTGIMLNSDKNDLVKNVKIYPNPVSEVLNVSLSENKDFTIEISNLIGESLYKNGYNNSKFAKINIESFSEGIYLVTIKSEGKSKTNKIIIK